LYEKYICNLFVLSSELPILTNSWCRLSYCSSPSPVGELWCG